MFSLRTDDEVSPHHSTSFEYQEIDNIIGKYDRSMVLRIKDLFSQVDGNIAKVCHSSSLLLSAILKIWQHFSFTFQVERGNCWTAEDARRMESLHRGNGLFQIVDFRTEPLE